MQCTDTNIIFKPISQRNTSRSIGISMEKRYHGYLRIILIVLVIYNILINTKYFPWFTEQNIHYKRVIKMFDG